MVKELERIAETEGCYVYRLEVSDGWLYVTETISASSVHTIFVPKIQITEYGLQD